MTTEPLFTPREILTVGLTFAMIALAGTAAIETANTVYVLIDPGPCADTLIPPNASEIPFGPHCVTAVLSWTATFATVFSTTIATTVWLKRRILPPPQTTLRREREE